MEDSRAPSETSDQPKYERKCEREFRKLLEADNHKTNNLTYYQKKVAFSENAKKKRKCDEQNTCKDSESDSFSENASETGSSYHKANLESEKCSTKKDLDSLFKILTKQHSPETRCQSVISLAVLCSENVSSMQLSAILNALDLLSDSHESEILAISHSVLLLILSKNTSNLDQIIYLEDIILKLAESVMLNTNELGNESISKLSFLRGEEYFSAIKLCQELFSRKNIDFDAIDVLTLCCSSLRNLSSNKIGEKYKYKPSTLNFILGMTGKATQEIVSEYLVADEENDPSAIVSASSHMVNQCLQILQHMLTVDPDLPCRTLDHEDFSLLHCLTRLFGWCMSFLFQKNHLDENHQKVEKSLSSFHLSTLLSILKILSILSFNPDQYDTFTNIRGLMEKVMICILKVYYQSEEKHFDILVLALELMINFFMKNKKTFILLCLKKFQINGCENVHSIEALLKILTNSLDKINEIKAKSLARNKNEEPETSCDGNSDDADMKSVLEAADEDMELSTIVSFISILLAFFMDTKLSFVDFIRERLSSEKTKETITVSRKVLQFASITGGMPATGILLLRHAIRKLSQLYLPT